MADDRTAPAPRQRLAARSRTSMARRRSLVRTRTSAIGLSLAVWRAVAAASAGT
jgi:hypothetical protein